MNFNIQKWDGKQASACRIHDIIEAVFPLVSPVDRQYAVKHLVDLQRGYEGSCITASANDQIVGLATLGASGSKSVIRLMGAVEPSHWGQGIGRALFDEMILKAKTYSAQDTLEATVFSSCLRGFQFLTKNGFVESDRLHWLERRIDQPFSDWVISKKEALLNRNIKILVGTEFEQLRPDWDRAWWALKSACDKDIPSDTPFEEIPFEEGRHYLEEPFCNRAHALIAVEGVEPVGILNLGTVDKGIINLNYTGVAASHRRQGVSLAMKVQCFKLAKSLGAHTISTQNHSHNPMLPLNKQLGFQERDAIVFFKRRIHQ